MYYWFLQIRIDYKDGQDDKMTLLLGLASTVNFFASVLTNFCLLPVDKTTQYPAITSGGGWFSNYRSYCFQIYPSPQQTYVARWNPINASYPDSFYLSPKA